MNGAQFIRAVRKTGRANGVEVRLDRSRGKGERYTVVGDMKKELKTGTLYGMLTQIGLTIRDLQGD